MKVSFTFKNVGFHITNNLCQRLSPWALRAEISFFLCVNRSSSPLKWCLTALSFSSQSRHPSWSPNNSMISLWFKKGLWRNSVSRYNGCLCLQLIWKPWAVGVRNVPNGPRNSSSHFTTARRKKKVTMNTCFGGNVNPPRRERGRSAWMKWSYLSFLAVECSPNFFADSSEIWRCAGSLFPLAPSILMVECWRPSQ